MTPRAVPVVILLLAALALGGCADRREWRDAQSTDTIEAYEAYLASRPQGDYVSPAQRRLGELKEARDWDIATQRDTAEAYRAFIDAYPKGRWVSEARIRIQNFLLDPMPPAVEDLRPPTEADEAAAAAAAAGAASPTDDAPMTEPSSAPGSAAVPSAGPAEDALFDAPTTVSPPEAAAPAIPRPAAPAARAAPAKSTEPAPVSHRIQLGAFGSREQAQAEWAQARTQHRELQGLVPLLTPVTSTNGTSMWRLQAGVVSEARAREICDMLQAARQPCVYTPPGR
ncbi:MAG: SPOR domain-containing protein [Gammaproteobacteria bacterium]|jgi:cell division septation protein DedD